jgi:hypothetical protein
MGTNYYRIPTVDEMESKKQRLIEEVNQIDLTPSNIERGFSLSKENSWESESLWDRFLENISIHLGKRSGGWKFCWNFHKNKYYSNREELLSFIRSGRVVDEYGDEQNVEEFIDMSLSWGQPDGWVYDEEYIKKERMNGMGTYFTGPEYHDKIIDGLRVSSSTEFS